VIEGKENLFFGFVDRLAKRGGKGLDRSRGVVKSSVFIGVCAFCINRERRFLVFRLMRRLVNEAVSRKS
jgi:hypothetical protein